MQVTSDLSILCPLLQTTVIDQSINLASDHHHQTSHPIVHHPILKMKRRYHDDSSFPAATGKPKRPRRHTHHEFSDQPQSLSPPDPPRFPHGNFQLDSWPSQARLSCFHREWFEHRDVLDIGCNVGFTTLAVALVFRPATILGLDIDANLIRTAEKNLSIYQQMNREPQQRRSSSINQRSIAPDQSIFPISMIRMYGPNRAPTLFDADRRRSSIDDGRNPSIPSDRLGFCRSVRFVCENYVLDNDDRLEKDRSIDQERFDTIVALNVTKWVHLNDGDDGLKRFFKRVFEQLRPGGLFVLDAQPWNLYMRNMKRLEATNPIDKKPMDLKPEKFKEYLLSGEVGFVSCRVAASEGKGVREDVRRQLLIFEKGIVKTR